MMSLLNVEDQALRGHICNTNMCVLKYNYIYKYMNERIDFLGRHMSKILYFLFQEYIPKKEKLKLKAIL